MKFEKKSYTYVFVMSVLSVSLLSCEKLQQPSAIKDVGSSAKLRELTQDERAQDFDALRVLFKSYYGPYQYKENLLGIKIDDLAATLKIKAQQAKSDEEFAGLVMQFGAKLKDGHVQISIENTTSGIARYNVPIVVTPIEGHAIIGDISESLGAFTGFQKGDEILEIDGKPPMDYLPILMQYKSYARDNSNAHIIAYVFSRPSYMSDLIPVEKFVHVRVLSQSGNKINSDIPWETTKYSTELSKLIPNGMQDLSVPFADDLNNIIEGHIKQMGQVDPVFVTVKTQEAFGFTKVYPSDATRAMFGLALLEKPPIYAAQYTYGGKKILLVREASYYQRDFSPAIYLKAYMALFSEFQGAADMMVLDQTHNPGGSYCGDFYNLFARDSDYQSAEYLHADRKWIADLRFQLMPVVKDVVSYDNRTQIAWSMMVEQAYDQGKNLSEAIPLFTGSAYAQPAAVTWKKPMLVLIDELAGSCGDMFPMLVKSNNRAKLFGQATMGLGGNVEEVGQLPNSRIHVSMTRGLFFPFHPDREPVAAEFIENNGVTPDYEYKHTVQDFRSGFVNYVKAFSDKALEQLK